MSLPGKLADCQIERPRVGRAVPRRGRLRRRLGEDGPRPQLPGDPAAARQDHQQREEPHQQGALEHRDPGDDHRDRHRHRRRVRRREAPLPPRDRDDRRRRRRLAHPHADPDVPLPPDAGARRARPRLHRRAAALQGQDRQPGALLREGGAARGAARRASGSRTSRSPTATAAEVEAHRGALAAGFTRALPSSRAGSARLRADFGIRAAELRDRPPPRRARRSSAAERRARRSRRSAPNGYDALRSLERDRGRLRASRRRDARRARATRRRSRRAARLADLRATSARRTRGSPRSSAPPPFRVALGKKTPTRETFDGAARRGARRSRRKASRSPLQGPRRDERRAALGDDDGPGERGC